MERPAPRGVVWDAASDRIHVACASGELVTFDAAGGPAVRSVMIERDLRDVLVTGGKTYVTKFKSAELLALDDAGAVTKRVVAPDAYGAWRTVVDPSGAIWMLHQRVRSGPLKVQQGGYGSRCEPVVASVLTQMPTDGTQPKKVAGIGDAALAIDVAVGAQFRAAVPSLGNAHTASLQGWHVFDARFPPGNSQNCFGPPPPPPDLIPGSARQFTSAAIAGGRLAFLSREPAALVFRSDKGTFQGEVELSKISREDTGHAIFHSNAGSFIACASCHFEGGEDGRVWTLDLTKEKEPDGTQSIATMFPKRRTPSLLGTVAGTAPYHWLGEQKDIAHLLDDVYSQRMNGGPLQADQKMALQSWVGSLPAPPRTMVTNEPARARGEILFKGKGACTTCHSNAKMTDSANHFVGMPFSLQTPSLLGVGWRAPFLHDGCAKTLANRFDPACRAEGHGNFGALSQADISDLVTYLESL